MLVKIWGMLVEFGVTVLEPIKSAARCLLLLVMWCCCFSIAAAMVMMIAFFSRSDIVMIPSSTIGIHWYWWGASNRCSIARIFGWLWVVMMMVLMLMLQCMLLLMALGLIGFFLSWLACILKFKRPISLCLVVRRIAVIIGTTTWPAAL